MKRPLTLVAAWLGAAGLAVGLGFLAVSLVGTGVSPQTSVAASTATTADVPSSTSSVPPTGPAATSAEQVTAGGTVLASCQNGAAHLAAAPTAGWRLDDSNRAGEVEFTSATQQIEVRADCSTGSPVFTVEGPRASDDGGSGGHGSDDHATPTTGPAGSPSTHGAGDDHGRRHGGHGADD